VNVPHAFHPAQALHPFQKLLVANRGEIACRVLRTARRLGLRTVAVYSQADAGAPHVLLADEAVCLGASAASDSYLNIAAVLAAAQATGADAVHPGYGFLSERADFAQACADAGLVFVGPPAAAIQAMGGKAEAKRRMRAAGVPCVPGYLGEDQSEARFVQEAARLGLPLLVKAVSGGGGRGMRLVHQLEDLPHALASARGEAERAFGDGTLMLERLLHQARHIEVQVFADHHGHTVHLGERDCTAQRRRQKVIEEAPSPWVDDAWRARLGQDAVAAAQAVAYVGAGTVEFIVETPGQHYFLEMNTRLQVEHPVTEAITGLDLVEWQLRVAAGEALPLTQDEIEFTGHAIEVRLYAEDPGAGFVPQTGTVLHWRPEPDAGQGQRVDSGIAEGSVVSPWYDAMVAKLIAHGRHREEARQRLIALLERTPLLGLTHNAHWLVGLLAHERFVANTHHTRLLDEWAEAATPGAGAPAAHQVPDEEDWQLAAALLAGEHGDTGQVLRPTSLVREHLMLRCGGQPRAVLLGPGSGVAAVREHAAEHLVRYRFAGVDRSATWVNDGHSGHLARGSARWRFELASPWPTAAAAQGDARELRAPVAGVVAQLLVAPGDAVRQDQSLLSVEAMKMEMWQTAAAAGRVAEVLVKPGQSVAAGALLLRLELA
jgi:geranyl-CoA carboxylase alpha subunit